MKRMKVMFELTSGADTNLCYRLGEVNIADNWNPNANDPKDFGGFNFSTEDKILRWLVRGDTIYDVAIPDDAEVVECESDSAPHGVFRTNKIILSNPKKVTDEMAMDLYIKSNLPEKSYYKALAGLAIRGHNNTAQQLIIDKINASNIDLAISEYEDFYKGNNIDETNRYNQVLEQLKIMKNNYV